MTQSENGRASELNPSQAAIVANTEGMVVVDAGPGTGKTHTIVERYLAIASRPDVSPSEILMLTFTNNSAAEMESRIKGRLAESGRERESKQVQASTFDSFCMSIVMDSPEEVGEFFGIGEKLTRGVTMSANETLNRQYFDSFLDRFLHDRGEDYGDTAVVASQHPGSVMGVIDRLMSRGIAPLRNGWFGLDADRELLGDTDALADALGEMDVPGKRSPSGPAKLLKGASVNDYGELPIVTGDTAGEDILLSAVDDDRTELFRFIHDVYLSYIRHSIADNRLTFGLNALFAFTLLYSRSEVRRRNSYRYVMIDEFQDTNANQMMIALMILSEPNLCVVGDWKQGIYGFRYVSIENIVRFRERAETLRGFLNGDDERVPFRIGEPVLLPLDTNYRSAPEVIEGAFECMYLPDTKDAEVDREAVSGSVVAISASEGNTGIHSEVRYVLADSKEDEVAQVVAAVRDYVGSGRYTVHKDGSRPLGFGDIAVICRKTNHCRAVMEALTSAGIPAFLQADMDIMSSREGKLALAWLRYVNNERDPWGVVPIMADMNIPMTAIRAATRGRWDIPKVLSDQRRNLYLKRRRVTEMLTSLYAFYGLDNDITQAIITTVSSAHRGSLLTISDIIGMMEGDIENGTVYPVENTVDGGAVRIMTMHKSKGLEFPAVIIPFMDSGTMPSNKGDTDVFCFDTLLGLRCTHRVVRMDGYAKICRSWRTDMVRLVPRTDRDEEKRLMFVAMSRAFQYETVISGDRPSHYMECLSRGGYTTIPDAELPESESAGTTVPAPDLSGYPARRTRLGVHDLMDFSGESAGPEGDEVCGKGKEYGEEVHRLAYMMGRGMRVDTDAHPELEEVSRVLDSVSDADLILLEVDCGLPVPGTGTTLRGRIDMMAVYPDRVEVHDYKTDVSRRFESEYRFQLSVYAHAAAGFYGKRVTCHIDYVSLGETEVFDPEPMDGVVGRLERHMSRRS